MKHLVASTALAVILTAPAWAQDQQQSADEAFLQSLESGDILVGELIGQDLYASAEDMEAEAPDDQSMETSEVEQSNGAEQDAEDTELDIQEQADADTQAEGEQQVAQDQSQTGDMRTISSNQLEGMETLGQVNEVVIDQQGEARGIVLQVDDREVAIDMQRISFALDQDDPEQVHVIADVNQDEIEQAPDFQRERMAEQDVQAQAADQEREQTAATEETEATSEETVVLEEDSEAAEETAAAEQQQDQPTEETAAAEQQQDQPAEETEAAEEQQDQPAEETAAIPEDADEQWRGDREAFAQPDVQSEGMQRAESDQVSVENLIEATLYDTEDNSIGDIDDVVAGEDGELQFLVVDVGGFLGIGTHTVALGLDEVTIMRSEDGDDIQVYVDATQEQLENMPEYAQN